MGGSEWKWSAHWHGFYASLHSKEKWAYRTFSSFETHWRRVSSQGKFTTERAVHPITLRKWSFISLELKWLVGQWKQVKKGGIFHLSALMYLRPFGLRICAVIMKLDAKKLHPHCWPSVSTGSIHRQVQGAVSGGMATGNSDHGGQLSHMQGNPQVSGLESSEVRKRKLTSLG